jgi:ABC-type nickel/cobalt efflux system permease component RcnA
MSSSLWIGWLFAVRLGVRHASEPDHLAAVSTLIADVSNAKRSALLGAIWGVGHSLSLVAVGGLLLLLHLRMPSRLADLFELIVSVMLLILGVRALRRALRASGSASHEPHTHGVVQHGHHAASDHTHVGAWTVARRPLGIGLIHGLAGSGALTALALANMPSFATALVYVSLFGLGSVLGMSLLTGLCGWPLRRLSRARNVRVALSALSGTFSLVLGVLWGWPLLFRLSGA